MRKPKMSNQSDFPTDDVMNGDEDLSMEEPVVTTDDSESQSLEDRVQTLVAELAETEKKALRYQADLDNYRRRARKEAEDTARYAVMPLVTELLDAVDNLNRAIAAGQTAPDSAALAEGVKMVADQLAQTLANHGCKQIETVGQPFDPNQHQAVQMIPSDEVPESHVAAELRAGFRLHDRVVRPAQVMVSTGSES